MGAGIKAAGLTMTYGSLRAVEDVTFEVVPGEFFGLLGPNGAGPHLLRRMGVQLQASSFFERLTAREQLDSFGALYGVARDRVQEMLEHVGLVDKASTRTEDLSGGQKQRLSIACALIHDPDIVFLDEPGTLDAVTARSIAGADPVEDEESGITITTRDPARILSDLAQRDALDGLSVRGASLEDVFLELTGREYRA